MVVRGAGLGTQARRDGFSTKLHSRAEGGGEPTAAGADMKGLVAHLERLERRPDLHRDLAKAALKEEVARAVQSVGAVVDYLTVRRLIDTADLKRHLQTSLLLTHGNDEGGAQDAMPRRLRLADLGRGAASPSPHAARAYSHSARTFVGIRVRTRRRLRRCGTRNGCRAEW